MFAGVVHPAPSEKLTASLAAGYGLTRAQLERTIPLLLQRPITVEHHGVFEAVRQVGAAVPLPADVSAAMSKLAETDASSAIVGSVVDAFIGPRTGALYIIYEIDELLMPSIEFLILHRFLPGLSMTHVVSQAASEKDRPDPQVVPYEVTLCSEPARPGCYTFLTGSSVELQRYKRSIQKGAIAEPDFSAPPRVMSAEEAQPPQRSEIEQAFDSIDNEETRKIIAARLTAMVKSLDASKAEKEALEQKYSGLVKASSVNERMLKNQLSLFQKQLGEEMCSDYCLNDEQTHSAIDGARDDPAALMQVFERTMVAASKRLMVAGAPENSRKRKADAAENLSPAVVAASNAAAAMAVVEEPAVVAASAAAAAAASPAEEEDILARALAATFSH